MRFNKLSLLVISILAIALLCGCGDERRPSNQDRRSNFRFINAISDVSAVDFYFNTKAYQLDVQFLEGTGYTRENLGAHRLQVFVSKSSALLVDTTGSFNDRRDQTFLVFGTRQTPRSRLIVENNSPLSSDSAKVRVINVSNLNRSIDVYIVKTLADIEKEKPTVSGLSLSRESRDLAIPKGEYQIILTNRSSKTPLTTPKVINLDGRSVYTILASDSKGAQRPIKITIFKS